ncbi:NAD(P)/FAD-dependent oxidoreductase [soil metagenome]
MTGQARGDGAADEAQVAPAFDVIVVGGGPVGLAAAIGARMAGFSVVVIEPRSRPLDKACGEGLMPGAVAELERLGVAVHGHPIAGITYRQAHGPRFASHTFARAAGMGVRRIELSRALTARATESGARFIDAKVMAVSQDARGVTVSLSGGSGIRGLWLLGCDGLHSPVRRMVGLEAAPRTGGSARRYGVRQHFRVAPWSANVEVYWARDCEVYVTPVDVERVGVAILGGKGLDLAQTIAGVPELVAHLGEAQPDSAVRGAGPLRQRTRRGGPSCGSRHSAGRVLLAGDASGYVDALTGEGLRIGFAQAAGAVAAIRAGSARAGAATPDASGVVAASTQNAAAGTDPAAVCRRYEHAWLAASRRADVLTGALLTLAHSPLRPAIVPIAAALPALFGSIVERITR